MKLIVTTLALFSFLMSATAENLKELNTKIEYVTVYLQGAQITRTTSHFLRPGRSTLHIKSLSRHLDPKTIQVKGTGDFTILSVNHSFNFLEEINLDEKLDSLIIQRKTLENEMAEHESRISVLKEKLSLLNENKKLGGDNMSASIDELRVAVEFYDRTLMHIKSEELSLKTKIQDIQVHLKRIGNQIREFENHESEPTSEIKVQVEADRSVKANLIITYTVMNAGWFPKYDLRVKDIQSPLTLTYKAQVHQNTGVDWDNVQLRLSNANPKQSGVAPELTTWYLNYQRNTIYSGAGSIDMDQVSQVSGIVTGENNEPLPGVNVIVKGTSVGTVTDVNGRYNITLPNGSKHLVFSSVGYVSEHQVITSANHHVNLQPDVTQLQEVVVTGYGVSGARGYSRSSNSTYRKPEKSKTVITTVVENQTTVEFEVEKPYSIKANGASITVSLQSHEIETLYEYYAVPKMDKDAFLIARIINWDRFNLLEGEANLYFEGGYVGRSVLDAKSLTDTLDISLGRDRSIVIGREKVDTFAKRNSLGSNKVETREFKIIVRNKKSQPIHITLLDQIPVPAISPIEVSTKTLSDGILDEGSGEITWVKDIASNSQEEFVLKYEVKYPKREKVFLE